MERRWESSMETWRRDLRQLAHGLQASSDSLHVLGSVCSDAAGEGASEHQGNIAVGGLGVTDWESEDLHAQVRSTLAMRKEREVPHWGDGSRRAHQSLAHYTGVAADIGQPLGCIRAQTPEQFFVKHRTLLVSAPLVL